MPDLTLSQRVNLHLAIDRARSPGHCLYAEDGAPCCPIGQLADIEGVPVHVLRAWDADSDSASGIASTKAGTAALLDYPLDLLDRVQESCDEGWADAAPVDRPEPIRAQMHAMVDAWGGDHG